jgi:hypothetical protein
MTRITFALTAEEEAAIHALRDHLVTSKPWVTKTDAIRAGLHEAVRAIADKAGREPAPGLQPGR